LVYTSSFHTSKTLHLLLTLYRERYWLSDLAWLGQFSGIFAGKRKSNKFAMPLDAHFWESRWQHGQTGWDLGAVSPPLAAYVDQLPPESRRWRVLIPGCGNGYEALYLLEKGFQDITMLDIAPSAVEKLRARLDKHFPEWERQMIVRCGDFFEETGPYDLILEQTFFCALDPVLRPDYARQMHMILAPGGRLAGVLFDRDFEGGPPFGGHRAEYSALFSPIFKVKTLEPCYNSASPRAGSEAFLILKRS
jgi:SAM-dependent methyltransferase